jgi:phosphonate transport system permease protein
MDRTVSHPAIPGLPSAQLAALTAIYGKAVARRRVFLAGGLVVFAGLISLTAAGAEVSLATFFAKLGNFSSYFYRILHLDNGSWAWTDPKEWFWGFRKWSVLIAETVLISYVGTIAGALTAFALNFLAARNVAPRPWLRVGVLRFLEFCRTVPGIVFALIFVIAFGLGPMAGVFAIMIHTAGALGKLYAEVVENIDMKPVEGVRATGASWLAGIRFAVVPQVMAGFASYTLLRFEINVREASVMGFVGAGGIGQELLVSIRKFYYSDVSAILVLVILLFFAIDISTGWIRHRLIGVEQSK